jgi:hypothetical protein
MRSAFGAKKRRHPGRRDPKRTSVTVAEQLHGLIAPRGIDHVAGHQAMAREAALVGHQAVFVLDAALDEIESEARKSPLGLAGANRRYSPRPGLS